MGNNSSQSGSKLQNTGPVTLTETPWRKTKGWDRDVRQELKDHIAGLTPQTEGQLDVPFFNIVLTGQFAAGKSSFFNSVNSIYQERVLIARAEVGIRATCITQEFQIYDIKPHPQQPDSSPLPWRICDTMGLDPSLETDYDVTNILKAVDGHVPDRFTFPNHEILQDTPGYVATPELKDKAHCVAVVINGNGFLKMTDSMKRKLRNLRTGLIARNVPTYILITHIDEACAEVNKDVSKTKI